MIRAILAMVLFLGVVSVAQAEPKIQGVDIVAAGIYKLGKAKNIDDPSISTGSRTQATPTLVQRTTNIPAKKDMVFGIQAHIVGSPSRAKVPMRIVWRYPEPGLHNPDTDKIKLTDEYEENRVIGETAAFYWNLGPDWTLVPGEWTIELWSGDRMLAKQAFQLQR